MQSNTRPSIKLTTEAARRHCAEALGVNIPRSSFYRLIEDGRITAFRIGCKIIIPKEALDDFLKRCYNGERY
jgi:excisionase family DNA binding protein